MSVSLPQVRNEPPWHRVGMGLSVLCLVHCLALPWLLASLPLVMLAALPGSVRANEWLHAALILPVLLVSGPVLLRGAPGRWQTGLVAAAFAVLIGALFVEGEGHWAVAGMDALLLMAGGISAWIAIRLAPSQRPATLPAAVPAE